MDLVKSFMNGFKREVDYNASRMGRNLADDVLKTMKKEIKDVRSKRQKNDAQ